MLAKAASIFGWTSDGGVWKRGMREACLGDGWHGVNMSFSNKCATLQPSSRVIFLI